MADLIPRTLLDGIVEYFHPKRVILFGSHARGTADADSDFDLLVLVDDETPPEKLKLEAGFEAARGYPGATDVIPCRLGTFARRSAIVGTLCHTAEQEGIVVYDRG